MSTRSSKRKAAKEMEDVKDVKEEAPPPEESKKPAEPAKKNGGKRRKNNEEQSSENAVNVRLGTLAEAKEGTENGGTLERYIYCDFARIEEEEYDVDYELDQDSLTQALEEATAMCAAQVHQIETYGPAPYSGMSTLTSNSIMRASGWVRSQRFPVKLYAILAQPALSHIITWMPHGRSWKVLKPRIFETSILPVFFESDNYHSFNRVVNAWSFRRKSSGPDRGSYFHELFLRGKPHLQKHMRRLPRTHKKLAMAKDEEPNFFDLETTSPLPTLAESKYSMETRKMKRLQEHFENGTTPKGTKKGPRGGKASLPDREAQREAMSGVARSFLPTSTAWPAAREAAAEGGEEGNGEKAAAGGVPSPQRRGQQRQFLPQADVLEQERYRQAFYSSQMGMMPGMPMPPYGAMNPMGPMNPYFQGPPPPL